MSRRRRRRPRSRRSDPCASDRATPLRPPSSPPHLEDDPSMTTSHAEPSDPVARWSERRSSSSRSLEGSGPRERGRALEARCGNRTLANPQLSLQP
jgi:hypothetical protein